MKQGYTLLELLVVVLIISILCAVAVPQYFNAVESARMVELKILWGSQRYWAAGKQLTAKQIADTNEHMQKHGLKYFTGEIVCRAGGSASVPCYEAVFTRKPQAAAQYQITTVNNFKNLACVPTNALGTRFCKSRSIANGQITVGGQEGYLIH